MVRMFRNPTTLSNAGKQPDDPGRRAGMSGPPQRPAARFMNTAGSASHSA